MNLVPEPYHIGDSCLCWQFGNGIDTRVSAKVIGAYVLLKEHGIAGVRDLVPSYNALAIHFDPLQTAPAELARTVSRLLRKSRTVTRGAKPATHRIPVLYDGEDLADLATRKQLGVDDVVAIHSGKTYTVAMIGFRPHFAYLLGLDPRLETPRRASPRPRVPPGAVGIGGKQTGIYPDASPGGWILIGRTRPELLPAIRIGDKVKFRSVNTL